MCIDAVVWRRADGSQDAETRMADTTTQARETIPEEVMLGRLAQSEQMRDFFIQMWRQNPFLAKQGGQKVRSLLTPLEGGAMNERVLESSGAGMVKQRGISLIELIMFIVIISVALTGILLVMNNVTSHSADPLLHKQAIAAAESLLEEIELQDFISASSASSTCPHNAVTQENRASGYHIVCDYNGFSTALTGIHPVSGAAAIGGLGSYNATVKVTATALGDIAAGSAVLITVTVTDPQGTDIPISGYRTAY
jgi:MSHA pilin protein MshD